jgi:hypothetical protein
MAPGRRAAALLACALLGLALAGRAAAQSTQGQAMALERIRAQLSPSGWSFIDPNVDPCANPSALTPGVTCSGNIVTQMCVGARGDC